MPNWELTVKNEVGNGALGPGDFGSLWYKETSLSSSRQEIIPMSLKWVKKTHSSLIQRRQPPLTGVPGHRCSPPLSPLGCTQWLPRGSVLCSTPAPPPAVSLWVSYTASVNFSFIICKTEVMAPTSGCTN